MVALTSDELLVAAPNTAESLVASLLNEDDEDKALGSALSKPASAASPADTTKSLSATAPADDGKVATTSTDGAGVIEVAVAVLDEPFTKMRELLFSASASGYTGAPPSAVTVHFDLGDAVPGVHFAGMPEGQFSLAIPMSGGTGAARVGYAELDPALLVTENDVVLAIVKGVADNNADVVFVPAGGGGPATMTSDGGVQWAAGTPISGDITTSRGDNPTIQINAPLSLSLNAYDNDMRFNGMFWALYADDVTSGETASDYHIIWSASAGTMTDPYGTTAQFIAPDFAAGQGVREINIQAVVDDVNRGADVDAFDDPALNAAEPVNVFQITLTLDQGGAPGAPPTSISPNYSGPPIPASGGGGQLGWIEPGNPGGSDGYYGSTQIKGTIPIPGRESGWTWSQDKKGTRTHTVTPPGGASTVVVDENFATWVPDIRPGDGYQWQDTDARHPNATGPDTREIFLWDAPGVRVGVGNNAGIGPPNNWTDINFDIDYKVWVNGPDGRISNELVYEVFFDLDEGTGTWVPAAHRP